MNASSKSPSCPTSLRATLSSLAPPPRSPSSASSPKSVSHTFLNPTKLIGDSQTIPGALIADSTSTRCEASLAQLESFRKQVDVLKSSNALLKDTIVRNKKIGTSARTPRVKKEGPVIPGGAFRGELRCERGTDVLE